jgi:L-ascorbate metabolism protein UlaG (beta-lactamase superfamily)
MARPLSPTAAARRERYRASRQYREGAFRNTSGASPGLKRGSTLSTMGQFFFGGERRVPLHPLPTADPVEAWQKAPESGLRATWLGHSTVLLELDGKRVLTDPVWGERASPSKLAGPKRFQPVPVAIERLPPLDAVLISHDHYDHLCQESVLALARAQPGVPLITALGVGARLEEWGIDPARIVELDWWESREIGPLSITAAPSQHFSGRGAFDRNSTLWTSFAVRGEKESFFFSGDTGLTPEYQQIRERLGPFTLTMLEVGAFHPAWGEIHLGPENALAAHALLGGGPLLPVHWGTFNLAIHAWDEPAETLVKLAPKDSVQLVMPKIGEPVEIARSGLVDPWWRPLAAAERKEREAGQCGSKEAEEESAAPLADPID